jgi:hypothetical protein
MSHQIQKAHRELRRMTVKTHIWTGLCHISELKYRKKTLKRKSREKLEGTYEITRLR